MVQQAEPTGVSLLDQDPGVLRRRRRRRGAIAQVVLFLTVWSTLVGLFGVLVVLPTLSTCP